MSEKSLLRRIVGASALLLFAAVMIWTVVWLIQQIWLWLAVGIAAVAIVWLAVIIVRWRRSRWLR
jgi:hypothetical protein